MTDHSADVLRSAAHDTSLSDDAFVMVSRALSGRDPLTGDETTDDPLVYFVGPDGYGQTTLWRGHGGGDRRCVALVVKDELDATDPVLWPALLHGLRFGEHFTNTPEETDRG